MKQTIIAVLVLIGIIALVLLFSKKDEVKVDDTATTTVEEVSTSTPTSTVPEVSTTSTSTATSTE